MCRIASLFLLQRLKGSMLGDAHDFNKIETQAVIKFFPARQGCEGNSRHSDRNIGGIGTIVCRHIQLPLYATVKNWVALFKRDFSTCVAPRPGRPKTVATANFFFQLHELNLEDRRISGKPVAEQLGISRGGLGPTIMKILPCCGSRNA